MSYLFFLCLSLVCQSHSTLPFFRVVSLILFSLLQIVSLTFSFLDFPQIVEYILAHQLLEKKVSDPTDKNKRQNEKERKGREEEDQEGGEEMHDLTTNLEDVTSVDGLHEEQVKINTKVETKRVSKMSTGKVPKPSKYAKRTFTKAEEQLFEKTIDHGITNEFLMTVLTSHVKQFKKETIGVKKGWRAKLLRVTPDYQLSRAGRKRRERE